MDSAELLHALTTVVHGALTTSISLQGTRVILPKKYGFFRRIFYRNNMGRHRNICEDGKVSSQIGGQNAEYFPIFHFRPVLGVKTEVF